MASAVSSGENFVAMWSELAAATMSFLAIESSAALMYFRAWFAVALSIRSS